MKKVRGALKCFTAILLSGMITLGTGSGNVFASDILVNQEQQSGTEVENMEGDTATEDGTEIPMEDYESEEVLLMAVFRQEKLRTNGADIPLQRFLKHTLPIPKTRRFFILSA